MQMRAEVAWPRPGDPTDEQYEALGRALPGLAIVIDDHHLYLYGRWTIDAASLADSASLAIKQAKSAHEAAFGAGGPDPVQVCVAPADTGLVPASLDLVGITGVGQILGASRQYASQLARAGGLPSPLGYPSGGPVWVRRAVEVAAATRRAGAKP